MSSVIRHYHLIQAESVIQIKKTGKHMEFVFRNLQACEFYNMTNATAGPNPLHQANHEGKPALRLCNAYWNSNVSIFYLVSDRQSLAPCLICFK